MTKEEWEEEHWNKVGVLGEVRASRPSTAFVRCVLGIPYSTNQRVPDMGKTD